MNPAATKEHENGERRGIAIRAENDLEDMRVGFG